MMMINNPALAGSCGDGELRLSYLNFYPGNNYNLHSVYFSYDSYFSQIHGGAGIYLTDDYLGGKLRFQRRIIILLLFAGSKDLFINGGLSASIITGVMTLTMQYCPIRLIPLEEYHYLPRKRWHYPEEPYLILGQGFFYIRKIFRRLLNKSSCWTWFICSRQFSDRFKEKTARPSVRGSHCQQSAESEKSNLLLTLVYRVDT